MTAPSVRYSDARAAGLGAASFFLPCGFTQAVQVYALSTGSPVFAGRADGDVRDRDRAGSARAGRPSRVGAGQARPTLLRLVGVVVLGFALVNARPACGSPGVSLPFARGRRRVGRRRCRPPASAPTAPRRSRRTRTPTATARATSRSTPAIPTRWTIESSTCRNLRRVRCVVPELGISGAAPQGTEHHRAAGARRRHALLLLRDGHVRRPDHRRRSHRRPRGATAWRPPMPPDSSGISPGAFDDHARRPPRIEIVSFPVEGMTCASCVNRITRFLVEGRRRRRGATSTSPSEIGDGPLRRRPTSPWRTSSPPSTPPGYVARVEQAASRGPRARRRGGGRRPGRARRGRRPPRRGPAPPALVVGRADDPADPGLARMTVAPWLPDIPREPVVPARARDARSSSGPARSSTSARSRRCATGPPT